MIDLSFILLGTVFEFSHLKKDESVSTIKMDNLVVNKT